MARTERTSVFYDTVLRKGLRENNSAGEIVDDGEDEPFVILVRRVHRTEVFDGRGKNWAAGSETREDVAELTLEEAGSLIAALAGDLAYAAAVAERRVLIPEPENNS